MKKGWRWTVLTQKQSLCHCFVESLTLVWGKCFTTSFLQQILSSWRWHRVSLLELNRELLQHFLNIVSHVHFHDSLLTKVENHLAMNSFHPFDRDIHLVHPIEEPCIYIRVHGTARHIVDVIPDGMLLTIHNPVGYTWVVWIEL